MNHYGEKDWTRITIGSENFEPRNSDKLKLESLSISGVVLPWNESHGTNNNFWAVLIREEMVFDTFCDSYVWTFRGLKFFAFHIFQV